MQVSVSDKVVYRWRYFGVELCDGFASASLFHIIKFGLPCLIFYFICIVRLLWLLQFSLRDVVGAILFYISIGCMPFLKLISEVFAVLLFSLL